MYYAFLLLNPSIWGTVSDWVMVIVTTITAYFLYRTLQSQKEVQDTQTRLFNIESIRFRESIKPILHYKFLTDDLIFSSEENQHMVTIEVTNETDSTALEVTPTYPDEKYVKGVVYHPNPNHLVKGDKPLFLHFVLTPSPASRIYIVFNVTYKDVSGNKYQQDILCVHTTNGLEINTYLPEIIIHN